MQDVTTTHDVWTYRDQSELGSNVIETHADLSGFSVEALDGSIEEGRRRDVRRRPELRRRRHGAMDLRQEGSAPGRRRQGHRRDR